MKMRIKPTVVDVIGDDGMWYEPSTGTYYDKDSLEPVVESKRLDEATEEYSKDEMMQGLAERAFRAGAQWQANQGATYEDTISADKTFPVLCMKEVSGFGLDYGDKVTVQIRKR